MRHPSCLSASVFHWFVALPFVVTGCFSSAPPAPMTAAPAAGTLTYQGRPVSNAQLTFHGATPSESGFALTDANGKFQCMTNDSNEGIAPGEYVVTITCARTKIPEKYADPDTSPISLPVELGEDNQFNLELTD